MPCNGLIGLPNNSRASKETLMGGRRGDLSPVSSLPLDQLSSKSIDLDDLLIEIERLNNGTAFIAVLLFVHFSY